MDRKIFDAHAHLAPGPHSLNRLLDAMDSNGIARAIVVAGGVAAPDVLSRQIVEGGYLTHDADNAALLDSSDQAGPRLIPFFFANPHRSADVYQQEGKSFHGLKLAPAVHGVPFGDDRMVTLVRVAADLGHNVYAHCLHREGFGVRDYLALARAFPAVTFALGHSGVGDVDLYGIDLIAPQENIVFETSCGLVAASRAALARLGPDRMMFGTEYPMQSPRVELAKLDALDLTDGQFRAIAWQNPARFAGLST